MNPAQIHHHRVGLDQVNLARAHRPLVEADQMGPPQARRHLVVLVRAVDLAVLEEVATLRICQDSWEQQDG